MSPGIDLTTYDGDVTSLFGELTDTPKGIPTFRQRRNRFADSSFGCWLRRLPTRSRHWRSL
jgi:hypothetical protein